MTQTETSEAQAEPHVVVLHEGEGKQLDYFGGKQFVTFKLTNADSMGRLGLYEIAMQPNLMGAGPHFHKLMVEMFYVLEGELLLLANDKKVLAKKGSFVSVPPGTIHAFANPGDVPNKFLVMFTPNIEREVYFENTAKMLKSDGKPLDPEAKRLLDLRFDTYRRPDIEFTMEKP